MAALFIPISLICTSLILGVHQPQKPYRLIWVQSLMVHSAVIIILTELLSIAHLLKTLPLLLFWIITILAQLLYLRQRMTLDLISTFLHDFKGCIASIKTQILCFPLKALTLISTLTIIVICFLTAIIAVPNNYDSLTYHMPRVMHWLQNQTVNHYPTNNLRQISFQLGASYIVANLQLLADGDYFANLVQCMSLLGSILMTSLIAQGFLKSSSLITSLLCASLPMAIMQSATTQTDLTTGFWLSCYTYFIFQPYFYSTGNLIWMSVALGLAISTKATALFLSAPLSIVLLWKLIQRSKTHNKILNHITYFFAVQICSLFLSFPHFVRNTLTFGQWLGEDTNTRVYPLSLESLLTNTVRNLSLNFPFPSVWKAINYLFEKASLSLNNQSDTYGHPDSFIDFVKNSKYLWTFLIPDEDHVASPLHFILIIISIFIFVWILIDSRNSKKINNPIILLTSGLMGFLIFSGLIKWMEWNNRLILPLLIILMPSIGYCFEKFSPKLFQWFLVIILSITGITYSLTPVYRPLISLPPLVPKQSSSILTLERMDRYYSGFGKAGVAMQQDYETITNILDQAKCYNLGLFQGIDDVEYPLWVSLQARNSLARIKHVKVDNPSKQAAEPFPDSELCAILEKTNSGFILRAPE